MKRLLWTAPAEADLASIDDYWWPRDRDVADRLIERIRTAAERLRSIPEGGAPLDQGRTRKWRAGRTPYVLIYRLRGATVEILRIHHDRQNWRPE
ncbi:MAG TPA: type II toxin-antitoxin system RelE/ParE family toxin [Sphingomonas sp.]|nr:type II toxin-antitoxin system RelE/ParE family toxin [Sphingomonas sp.]